MDKTILVLGGYGNAGRLITQLLLLETELKIIIAGRNLYKAKSLAENLNRQLEEERVIARKVDASDRKSLSSAFEKVNFVLVASSTIHYTKEIVESALTADIDYFDIQLSTKQKLKILKTYNDKIQTQKRIFITDGGFHPGVPAALAGYADIFFDILDAANVGSVFQIKWPEYDFSESTVIEMIEEFKYYSAKVFKRGKWIKSGYIENKSFNFGKTFGSKSCYPMYLAEFELLPEIIPSLKETGFYISGFNRFTDYIVLPITYPLLKIFPKFSMKPLARLFKWSLTKFSKPPYGVVLQLNAKGLKGSTKINLSVRLSNEDAYMMTAVPVVACLLQYVDGTINKPGLHFQANAVNPTRFIEDIERLGINVETQQELIND